MDKENAQDSTRRPKTQVGMSARKQGAQDSTAYHSESRAVPATSSTPTTMTDYPPIVALAFPASNAAP